MDHQKEIWLINAYGPIEGEGWRDYRYNQFGKYLAGLGYKVVWWTASFAHHFKKYRSNGWKDLNITEGFDIRLVPTSQYQKNLSLKRLWKDMVFAHNVWKRAHTEKPPALIICAENPLTMGYPSFRYAYKRNIPIVADQMDIWPEFMVNQVPKKFKGFVDFLLRPFYARRKVDYEKLSGCIALGKNYLEFMLAIAPVLKNRPHVNIYNGIDVVSFRKIMNINEGIVTNLPEKRRGEVWCVFAGTFGPSYDINTMIACARRLHHEGAAVRFLFAGSGSETEMVEKASTEIETVHFLGALSVQTLLSVYKMCDIGLCAYSEQSNVDMPDKFYDYCAAGLAVVNSLQQEVRDVILANGVGQQYMPGNADSMSEAIYALCDPEALRLAKAAADKVAMIYDMNAQHEKLSEMINVILEKEKS